MGVKSKVFYSWQSDIKAAANRTLIQTALEAAVKEIRDDDSIGVEPVVDRDTLTVPGSPDIGATILEKIDASTIFVGDVTIVNRNSRGEATPNPNVLVELGYALKALGNEQVILVQNTAFGSPKELPFDLRQKRVMTYESPEQAGERSTERRTLQGQLRKAVLLILEKADERATSRYPVRLGIDREETRITGHHHDYQLRVVLKNEGSKTIKEWHVELRFPTVLLNPHTTFARKVEDRSDERWTLFRGTQGTHGEPIYQGDGKVALSVDYYVDELNLAGVQEIANEVVTATAYAHGERAAMVERPVRDLHVF